MEAAAARITFDVEIKITFDVEINHLQSFVNFNQNFVCSISDTIVVSLFTKCVKKLRINESQLPHA